MNFKEMVDNDVNNILFNTSELASSHKIDNKNDIIVIVDNYKLSDYKNKAQYSNEISTAEMLIYIKENDLGYIPTKGNIIKFDNDVYRVLQVAKFGIVLEIIFEANI